jgi:hypothetical protein
MAHALGYGPDARPFRFDPWMSVMDGAAVTGRCEREAMGGACRPAHVGAREAEAKG